jgi:outer membrane protein OmpA-like peptidoglycan-associated protein
MARARQALADDHHFERKTSETLMRATRLILSAAATILIALGQPAAARDNSGSIVLAQKDQDSKKDKDKDKGKSNREQRQELRQEQRQERRSQQQQQQQQQEPRGQKQQQREELRKEQRQERQDLRKEQSQQRQQDLKQRQERQENARDKQQDPKQGQQQREKEQRQDRKEDAKDRREKEQRQDAKDQREKEQRQDAKDQREKNQRQDDAKDAKDRREKEQRQDRREDAKDRRDRDDRRDDARDRRDDRRESRDRDEQRDDRRERKLDELRKERRERREGDRVVIQEGNRTIIREGNRTIIRRDESDRFRRFGRDVNVQRFGGETRTVVVGPNGQRIVTITDDNGRLLRRSRFVNDREVVIIDNRPRGGRRADAFFVALPPLAAAALAIPRERYIVEAAGAPPEYIYDALMAPPVERLPRAYTLDEIRYSPEVRERMPRIDLDTITFDLGSWEVTPDQYQRLAPIAEGIRRAIAKNADEVFLIEGHTDATGNDEDNLSLSDRRAEAVSDILTEQFKVPPENLTTQGYGAQQLKVQTTAAERANRRVTVRRITPLLQQGDASAAAPK